MSRPSRNPHVPTRTVWHSPSRSPAMMLDEIRTHAGRGTIVIVIRGGGGSYQVIRNGDCYLVRTSCGDPLATVDTVGEAVRAGDAHLCAPPPEDEFDDDPRGAA